MIEGKGSHIFSLRTDKNYSYTTAAARSFWLPSSALAKAMMIFHEMAKLLWNQANISILMTPMTNDIGCPRRPHDTGSSKRASEMPWVRIPLPRTIRIAPICLEMDFSCKEHSSDGNLRNRATCSNPCLASPDQPLRT